MFRILILDAGWILREITMEWTSVTVEARFLSGIQNY
jgi:hypothetical protein